MAGQWLAYLCLAGVAFMSGDSNLIKDAMQLLDNVIDLGGQVACVDRLG
jgi:hypothetical protein